MVGSCGPPTHDVTAPSWLVLGLFMVCSRDRSRDNSRDGSRDGALPDYSWFVNRLVRGRDMVGTWLGHGWYMVGIQLGHGWYIIGTWLVHNWDMVGTWLGHGWDMAVHAGTWLVHNWDMVGTWLRRAVRKPPGRLMSHSVAAPQRYV
eukprot:366488-Chlamydomonas_euryale.AAC.9